MFVFVLLCITFFHSIFAIILKRKMIALLILSYRCTVTIHVLWLGSLKTCDDIKHVAF